MSTYKRHRFPPEMCFRFNLSYRDIEDLLAQRGIEVGYESVRSWCLKFGAKYAKRLRKRQQGFGDTYFIDEVFVKIGGKQHYLWLLAVDQDGDMIDVVSTKETRYGSGKALFQASGNASPRTVITDKLISYGAASRELKASWLHDTSQ